MANIDVVRASELLCSNVGSCRIDDGDLENGRLGPISVIKAWVKVRVHERSRKHRAKLRITYRG